MSQENKWLLLSVIAILTFGFFYVNPLQSIFSAFDIHGGAAGQLSRAITAQTPNEVIEHVQAAQRILPISGTIAWWSPERGDFESLQAELDDITIRARHISGLQVGDEIFNSEMYDIHSKVETIQERLVIF